jgi:hypothetical protein
MQSIEWTGMKALTDATLCLMKGRHTCHGRGVADGPPLLNGAPFCTAAVIIGRCSNNAVHQLQWLFFIITTSGACSHHGCSHCCKRPAKHRAEHVNFQCRCRKCKLEHRIMVAARGSWYTQQVRLQPGVLCCAGLQRQVLHIRQTRNINWTQAEHQSAHRVPHDVHRQRAINVVGDVTPRHRRRRLG